MSTTAKIAPRLRVLGSRLTMLGTKATVALYLGDEEVFCDEVKLWQARSREAFIERCLAILKDNDPPVDAEFSKQIDAWLRVKDRELSN